MTSIDETKHQAIRPLSDQAIELVSGGCFPIPVSDGHGGVILISPTIGPGPRLPTGPGPTNPFGPFGPFPL